MGGVDPGLICDYYGHISLRFVADDRVFRALADPTRRALLDALFESDGQSVGALSARFPELTRFAVMKHLRVLAEANLVATQRQGRSTLHYLNPVPIAQLAERWISKYAAPFSSALVGLDRHVRQHLRGAPMSRPAHVYQIYIAATPEQVWTAMTDSEWRRRYFHDTAFTEPPVGRSPVPHRAAGRSAGESDGLIEEMTPPAVRAGGAVRVHLARPLRRGDGRRAGRPGGVDGRPRQPRD